MACGPVCMAQDASTGSSSGKRAAAMKARYLSLLPKYLHWPEGKASPAVIGTMRKDRGEAKYVYYLSKKSKGQFVLKRFSSPEKIQACHILFLSVAVGPEIQSQVISVLRGRPILIVGDSPGILQAGGAVLFKIEQNRMFLMVSKSALKRANLRADSGFLALDSVVVVD